MPLAITPGVPRVHEYERAVGPARIVEKLLRPVAVNQLQAQLLHPGGQQLGGGDGREARARDRVGRGAAGGWRSQRPGHAARKIISTQFEAQR